MGAGGGGSGAAMKLETPGFYSVAAGKLATVVTSLDMSGGPQVARRAKPDGVELEHWPDVDIGAYRELYRHVGEPWLWFSRLRISDADLAGIVNDADVDVYAVTSAGRAEGLLELDFRRAGECELAFFGVSERLIGSGVGGWLMAEAQNLAWARPIDRFWVHTCTLDHPGALGFYCYSGFVPYEQQVELIEDPRLNGTLSADAACTIPLAIRSDGTD